MVALAAFTLAAAAVAGEVRRRERNQNVCVHQRERESKRNKEFPSLSSTVFAAVVDEEAITEGGCCYCCLLWGASKLVPVGYGIKKLQIMMTIVDDLVSVDSLIEEHLTVEPVKEYVQSCDIVAFNKI
ncbi:hypothetical protein PIB30_014950 [Stylosanthes scabra]|uniref:Translation elongation factor EF1B beta/delta subunit guanine nucleotide exchange domain-containing protein n=1 Tax=Stylosanthes scabra TaxID=79078 RepID=A0ABU6W843_9FABA|nr:hypothetical protein [Stylosanthes scabra]